MSVTSVEEGTEIMVRAPAYQMTLDGSAPHSGPQAAVIHEYDIPNYSLCTDGPGLADLGEEGGQLRKFKDWQLGIHAGQQPEREAKGSSGRARTLRLTHKSSAHTPVLPSQRSTHFLWSNPSLLCTVLDWGGLLTISPSLQNFP